ncbi:MAG: Tripartite ATP-independent periplasmic transporter [Smithella sp. PtaU1.Bin162]|nr:MAG: Tripartite ATP-independent periplasmic transporter [Smithella sp. PtaU1.Bin162]
MGILNGFIKMADTVSEWSGKITSWLILILTLMTGYEIIMRYVFNAPTKWCFDMSYMLGGAFFVLGQGYTLLLNKHVRIDIFYSRLSLRGKAIVDSVFYLIFFFPLWIVLLYLLIPYVYESWIVEERSMQGYWMPILYPFKTVMPVAVFILILQAIAEFIRCIRTIMKGNET